MNATLPSLCHGRHALEMQHILGALSLDAYLITGNGTRVHSLEGELLHRDDLPADVAELVLYQQWDTRASMHIFNDDGWFTGKEILRCCRHLSIAVFVIR